MLLNRRDWRRLFISLAISVAVAAVLSVGIYKQVFHGFMLATTDYLFLRTELNPVFHSQSGNIVIVAIDEASLARFQQRHGDWPRQRYAQVLDFIASGNPRVLAFDICFCESHEDDSMLGLRVHAAYSWRGGERSRS